MAKITDFWSRNFYFSTNKSSYLEDYGFFRVKFANIFVKSKKIACSNKCLVKFPTS